MAEAITAGGGHVVAFDEIASAEALVWSDPYAPELLEQALAAGPDIRWVQLPFAGVEHYIHLVDDDRAWTCGKGVYAEPVAELALSLALAGMRGLGRYARSSTWQEPVGINLLGARVTIMGGGGITDHLLRLLRPFDCHVTVVRNHVQDMDGVDDVLAADRYVDGLPNADLVVLALPLTPDTEGIISRDELAAMERHAWLINVARGQHVITDDLVEALANGEIGGAGLDVTDPEPLPDGHPLWAMENCIITPHTGNTPEMGVPLLSERIITNVHRFAHGEGLIGSVDGDLGY
jgi:phosphoglycerate dehydrogenase-like enzyme